MYVYVKFEGVVKVFSNVTIDEDCGPVVDGKLVLVSESPRNGADRTNSRGTVDTITWFKSLPVEAVYIDCSARDVKWCPKSVKIQERKSERLEPHKTSVRMRKTNKRVLIDNTAIQIEAGWPCMPDTARPLISDHPGVADFNPLIDEMFERSEDLIRKWDTRSELENNTEIAQILHSCVFPEVYFQKQDIPVLQECLRLVVIKQETVERDIKETERNVDITEKYLNKQREVILAIDDFATQSYLQACDKDFVQSFYVQATKDLQKKNMRLDNIQMKINDLKKTEQDPEKREKLKKERDGIHEVVQKLIIVREAIRNHLYRPFIPKKKKRGQKVKISKEHSSLHLVFRQVHEQLVEHKDHLRKLCYRKLYTSSVREAIESTIKMIRQETPRGVGDFSEFSVYMGKEDNKKKQWQSMQAQVDEWMATDGKMLSAHQAGCQLVKDVAEGILSDSQMASLGLEEGQAVGLGDFEMSTLSSTGTMVSGAAAEQYDMNDVENDPSYRRAPMVRLMRDQVKVHTWEMAENIVNFMDFQVCPGSRHINRAWVCYCPYFWRDAGEAVERVYRHFHAPQARKVYRIISSVALADIMDSNFFHDFFTQRLSQMSGDKEEGTLEECSAGASYASMDAVSAVSLDMMRCSVSDLYARVNRDGAKLNYQMLEMDSLTASLLSFKSCSSMESTEFSKTSCSDFTTTTNTAEMETEERKEAESSLRDSSASDSGDSVHSEDLFDFDSDTPSPHTRVSESETIRSSQTVSSVMTLFDVIVGPYHKMVQDVLDAADIMEKMRAVWKSVDFLCQKAGELCKARGMDTLLPLSIFATTSFSEDLFVSYYIQLLILMDLKPSFAFHSMYDFSLTNAISCYMYLFEARFPNAVPGSDESDT